MIVARGLGRGSNPGSIVARGMTRKLSGVVVSVFQDCIEFIMYITRSVSISLER